MIILSQRTIAQMARIDKFYQKLYTRTVQAQVVDELAGVSQQSLL